MIQTHFGTPVVQDFSAVKGEGTNKCGDVDVSYDTSDWTVVVCRDCCYLALCIWSGRSTIQAYIYGAPHFSMYFSCPRTSVLVLFVNGAIMFKTGMLKSSHQSKISLRMPQAYPFRCSLPQRFHGPLPRRPKKPIPLALRVKRVFPSDRPIMEHTDRHGSAAKPTHVRPMPIAGSRAGDPPSQPAHGTKQSAEKPPHAHALSSLLKSIVAALDIVLCSSCIGFDTAKEKRRLDIIFTRAVRRRPPVLKFIRALERGHLLRFIGGSLVLIAFGIFIVLDIPNLSHDEPIEVKSKKSIREDPVAALSDIREELARIMKEESPRER